MGTFLESLFKHYIDNILEFGNLPLLQNISVRNVKGKKCWHVQFQKSYGHQIWIASISERAGSGETTSATVSDAIALRSCNFEKPS